MIWSIAWENVWRNKRRSLVVIIAVTLGIIAGTFLIGIMEGWTRQRLNDAIYNEVSHIQIHNPAYLRNEEIDLTVKDLAAISNSIDTIKQVKSWVKRTKIVVMANTPWANTGIMLYGIDPEREKKVTNIYKELVPGGGKYPDNQTRDEILISDKTAELLKLKQYIVTDSTVVALKSAGVPQSVTGKIESLKGRLYRSPKDFRDALAAELTAGEFKNYSAVIASEALVYRIRNKVQITTSDIKGNPVQGIFRVCGIYKTTNTGFDQSAAFVNGRDLAGLCGTDSIPTHEIAILLKDINDVGIVRDELKSVSHGNSVETWREMAPDAAMMNDFMLLYYFIYIGIIMLALAFGIINTMLMAILERTKELGMLMAIGMNRKRIFFMIMLETVFLTFTGALAGMLLGWGIMEILGRTGIYFAGWGEGFEAIGFAARVYPVVTPQFFAFTTAMVIVTAIVASIWPARKALKLIPVDALRTE